MPAMQVRSFNSADSDMATLPAMDSGQVYKRTVLISSPADKRHLGCHDSQKLDVGVERQICHIDDRFRHMAEVEGRFRRNHTAGLWHSLFHSLGQLCPGIADIDLATSDIVF